MSDKDTYDIDWTPSDQQIVIVGLALVNIWGPALSEARDESLSSKLDKEACKTKYRRLKAIKKEIKEIEKEVADLYARTPLKAKRKNPEQQEYLVGIISSKKLEYKLLQSGLASTGSDTQDWAKIGIHNAEINDFKVSQKGRRKGVDYNVDVARAKVFVSLQTYLKRQIGTNARIGGLGNINRSLLVAIFRYMANRKEEDASTGSYGLLMGSFTKKIDCYVQIHRSSIPNINNSIARGRAVLKKRGFESGVSGHE